MVLRVWLCDPKLHKHLAVPDRGRARIPDDARQRANVSEQTTGAGEWVPSRGADGAAQRAALGENKGREYSGVFEFTGY